MEGKKSKRGKGKSPGGHGRLIGKKNKTAEVMNEKERLDRLEAASVLSSLHFSLPQSKQPPAKLRKISDSNGFVEATTTPVTYISTAPSAGIPTSHAPSSVTSTLYQGTQLTSRGSGTLKNVSESSNAMIIAHLNLNNARNKHLTPAAAKLKQALTQNSIRQLKPHPVSTTSASRVPNVVLNAESSKLPLTLNPIQTINKSVATALRQVVSLGGSKKQTVQDTEQIVRADRGSPKTEISTYSEIENLESDSISGRKKDCSDNNLPLKKRRLVALQDSSNDNATVITSSQSLPSIRVASLTSAAQIENILQMARDYPSSDVRNLSVISSTMLEEKPPAVEGYRPVQFDPRTSLLVLSDVKVALTPDEDGDLPIHIAVVHQNTELVKKFIDIMAMSGKSLDRYNKLQQTPLHLAVLVDKPDIVSALLSAGANPNLMDRNGCTSLHLAINKKFFECLHFLYEYTTVRIDANIRNYEGYPPLHTCAELDDFHSLMFLVKKGADFNIQDGKAGRSVIFYATEYNRVRMVDYLVSVGANAELHNYAGISPFMTALAAKHQDIIEILQKAIDTSKLTEDPLLPLSKKMAIPRIPSKSSLIVPDTLVRSRSNSFSRDLRPISLSRQSSRSSNQSPIDLSFNRNSDSPSEISVSDKESKVRSLSDKLVSSNIKEKHTQLIAALEGRNMANRKFMVDLIDRARQTYTEVSSKVIESGKEDNDGNVVYVQDEQSDCRETGHSKTEMRMERFEDDHQGKCIDHMETSRDQTHETMEHEDTKFSMVNIHNAKTCVGSENDKGLNRSRIISTEKYFEVDRETSNTVSDSDVSVEKLPDGEDEEHNRFISCAKSKIDDSIDEKTDSVIPNKVSRKEIYESLNDVPNSESNTPPDLLEKGNCEINTALDNVEMDQDDYDKNNSNDSPEMPILSRATSVTIDPDSNPVQTTEVSLEEDEKLPSKTIFEENSSKSHKDKDISHVEYVTQSSQESISGKSGSSQGFDTTDTPVNVNGYETSMETDVQAESKEEEHNGNIKVTDEVKPITENEISSNEDNDGRYHCSATQQETELSKLDTDSYLESVETCSDSGVAMDDDDCDVPLIIDENIVNTSENGEHLVTSGKQDIRMKAHGAEAIQKLSIKHKENNNSKLENSSPNRQLLEERNDVRRKIVKIDSTQDKMEKTGNNQELAHFKNADTIKGETEIGSRSSKSETNSNSESKTIQENKRTKPTGDATLDCSKVETFNVRTYDTAVIDKDEVDSVSKQNLKPCISTEPAIDTIKSVTVAEPVSKMTAVSNYSRPLTNTESTQDTLVKPSSGIDELKSGQSHTFFFHDGDGFKPVRIFIDNSKQSSLVLQQMLQTKMANLPDELVNPTRLKETVKVDNVPNEQTPMQRSQTSSPGNCFDKEKASLVYCDSAFKQVSKVPIQTSALCTETRIDTSVNNNPSKQTNIDHQTNFVSSAQIRTDKSANVISSKLTRNDPPQAIDILNRTATVASAVRNMLNSPARVETQVSNVPIRPRSMISVSTSQPPTSQGTRVGDCTVTAAMERNSTEWLQQDNNSSAKNIAGLVPASYVGSLSKGQVTGKLMKSNPTVTNNSAVTVTDIVPVRTVPANFSYSAKTNSSGKELNKKNTIALERSVKTATNSEKTVLKQEIVNKNIPNLMLMTNRKYGVTVGPSSKTSGFPPGRGPVSMTEGTLTRVSQDIKSKLSKALQSPQRKLNQNRSVSQDIDSRYPHIQGIGGHIGASGAEVISSKGVVETRQQM